MQRLTAPSKCEPHLWTETFFSYPILNALQQAAGSGLLCTQVMKVMLFFSTLVCSQACSLTSLERHKEKDYFPYWDQLTITKKADTVFSPALI